MREINQEEITDETTLDDRGFIKQGNAMFVRSYELNKETRFIEISPGMYQYDGEFPIIEGLPVFRLEGGDGNGA